MEETVGLMTTDLAEYMEPWECVVCCDERRLALALGWPWLPIETEQPMIEYSGSANDI